MMCYGFPGLPDEFYQSVERERLARENAPEKTRVAAREDNVIEVDFQKPAPQ